MARTAIRRPGPAGKATPPEAPPPAVRVRARSLTHVRDGMLLSAFGVAGFGAAPLLGQPSALGTICLVAGVGAGAAVTYTGQRSKQRRALEDRVLEALAGEGMSSVLRVPHLDRKIVRFDQWTSGWPGVPRRIRIRYSPLAQDRDPGWSTAVVEVLARRLLRPYKVMRHDPLNCVLWVGLDTTVVELIDAPHAQARAERALSKLIDASVKLVDVEITDDELQSITISHDAGEKMAAAGARTRVERTVSAMHPGRWRAKWDLEGDTVRFEQRPTLPSSVWLPPEIPDDVEDLLANYEKVRIPYAINEDGEEMAWQPARIPQMLITGQTGSGKTSTTHSILGKITQYGWPVWVVDGKRVEFLHHRTWPNVQIVATTVAQQVALIHRVWLLQEERYRLMEEEGVRVEDFEPLVVILDEWAEFVAALLDWYGDVKQKGDPAKPPTLREEASLARKARTARIHLVKTMQRPDVALLGGVGGEARTNFGQRISVGRMDPQGAMMMWDNPGTGTTIPRGARQRSMATNDDGVPVEVQCYRFPSMTAPEDSDEGRMLQALRPTRTRHPRLLILPPESEDGTLGIWDYAKTAWVRADARPDLDPVVQGARRKTQAQAREAAAAMSVLGLRANELTRGLDEGTPRQVRDLRLDGPAQDSYVDEYAIPVNVDDYTGYAQPLQVPPSSIAVGDLIQVDDADGWVAVDQDPEEDALDPGAIAISWRSDADEFGSISLPNDTHVSVRRPEEIE